MKEIRVIGNQTQFLVNVYTLDDFDQEFQIDDLCKGALVAEEVIDILRNNLPPVTDWSFLFQCGGSICDRLTDDRKLHPAYATFMTSPGLPYWEHRGSCLKGEYTERGEVPIWQRRLIT